MKRGIRFMSWTSLACVLVSTAVLAASNPRMEKAAAKGDVATVKQFLAEGVDVNARYDINRTALIVAASMGREAVVAALLDAGANPNLQDANSQTALMLAGVNAHLPVVKLLINRGADSMVRTSDGQTVFDLVNFLAYSSNNNIVAGRDPRIIPVAQYLNSAEVKDKMRAAETKGSVGNPRMEKAAEKGDVAAVKQLIAQGVDANARYDLNRTALMVAARKGYEPVATALLDAGANPNLQDVNSRTALMLAGTEAHLAVVKLLINRGADPMVRTSDGQTVFDLVNFLAYSTNNNIVAGRDPRIIPVAQYLNSNEVKDKMRTANVAGSAVAATGGLVSKATNPGTATSSTRLVRPLLVDLAIYQPGVERLRSVVEKVMTRLGYTLELTSRADYVQGSQATSNNIYKVGVRLHGHQAMIGWVEGYQGRKQNWLVNIERNILAEFEREQVSR